MKQWQKFYNQLKKILFLLLFQGKSILLFYYIYFYKFRCVDDGYCLLEQANLIQQYVEKKLGKLYKIDETIGKSLLKIDDDDDDEEENDLKDRKSMIISDDDENSHLSLNDHQNSLINETKKHISSNDNNNVDLSPSLTTNNRLSPSLSVPSPSKDTPSPGEITKAISPSSLSEASPILD
jgi:hypothetical protein